jgi:hypothetical protein
VTEGHSPQNRMAGFRASNQLGLTPPRQYRDSFWPPDTVDHLRGYADQHRQRLEEAAGLTTRLLAGLILASVRSHASESVGLPPDPRDVGDERALNRALADAHGQHPNQVFAEVSPGIAARIMQLTNGPGKAAELSRENGCSGTRSYRDISTEGETEPMTDANRRCRALLVTAYAGAYRDAAVRRPPPANSPARIAARGLPGAGQPSAETGTPDPPGRGAPSAPPRHGPRRDT